MVSIAFSLTILATGIAVATERESKAEKHEDIKRLMLISGAGDLGVQIMNQMVGSFKQSLPQVPDTFWDEFRKDINADALIDLCVPIYDKHLSHADIKELIRFYETPAGKRILKALPLITQESVLAGQKLAQDIAQKAIQRLEEKGYK